MTSTYIDSGIATADRFLPRLFVADEVRNATVTATSGTPAPVKNLTTYSAWTPSAFPATVTADFGSSKSFDYVAAYLKSASGNYTLEYWNGSAWVAIGSTLSRTTPGCILWLFPSKSAAKNPHHLFRRVRCRGHQVRRIDTDPGRHPGRL